MSGGHARYRVLDHTGDFAFEVDGADLPGLVSSAVLAVVDAMFGEFAPGLAETVEVRADAMDPEMAIFKVLSEVVYLVDARRLVPCGVEAAVEGGELVVRLWCDRLDQSRHRQRRAFKAATLHGLHVERAATGVRARVVMDV